MSLLFGEVAEREECVIEWTVKDFFSIPDEVEELYLSPSFSFYGAQLSLSMYPNGLKVTNTEGYITIGLALLSGPPIELNFSIGLKTSQNKIAEERHGARIFDEKKRSYSWAQFLRRSELAERQSELAPSGHLIWVCRIKHPPSTDAASKFASGDNSSSASFVTNKILEDLKQLFLNQQNCDVILRVKGREFHAHKLILTARSPAFASLFQSDTKEKTTAVVDIEDCNPSTFSDFLRFLYCQEVDRLSEENVLSLLAAADKYRVSDLRTKCLEFMKEKFSVLSLDDTVAPRHSETESIQLAAA